jgi:hypothetical protein
MLFIPVTLLYATFCIFVALPLHHSLQIPLMFDTNVTLYTTT